MSDYYSTFLLLIPFPLHLFHHYHCNGVISFHYKLSVLEFIYICLYLFFIPFYLSTLIIQIQISIKTHFKPTWKHWPTRFSSSNNSENKTKSKTTPSIKTLPSLLIKTMEALSVSNPIPPPLTQIRTAKFPLINRTMNFTSTTKTHLIQTSQKAISKKTGKSTIIWSKTWKETRILNPC
jgi:hypothetical protein